MKIDVKEHNKPVPKVWYRTLVIMHGILGLSVVGAAVENKPWIALGVMVAGYVVDQIIRFIKQDNPGIDAQK